MSKIRLATVALSVSFAVSAAAQVPTIIKEIDQLESQRRSAPDSARDEASERDEEKDHASGGDQEQRVGRNDARGLEARMRPRKEELEVHRRNRPVRIELAGRMFPSDAF